jgi:hypothetical protein
MNNFKKKCLVHRAGNQNCVISYKMLTNSDILERRRYCFVYYFSLEMTENQIYLLSSNILHYIWYMLIAPLFCQTNLATRREPEFLWSFVDTTQFILLYSPFFFSQINYILVSELTINFKI